jgi:uncharacterized protein
LTTARSAAACGSIAASRTSSSSDRGELDKLIERAATEATPSYAAPPGYGAPGYRPEPLRRDDDRYERRDYDRDDDRFEHRGYDRDYRYDKRKRKSFLREIFDFD